MRCRHTTARRAVTALLLSISLGACANISVDAARLTTVSTSRAFTWSTTSQGESVLIEVEPQSLAILQELDRGTFLETLGPYETPNGIAWARRAAGEEWHVIELGVAGSTLEPVFSTDSPMRRSSSRNSALAAIWHIERVIAGHAPGNAAEFASIRPFARANRWPR